MIRPSSADAAEHNAIVLDLLRERGMTTLIKSKSMLTDECAMRDHLESAFRSTIAVLEGPGLT